MLQYNYIIWTYCHLTFIVQHLRTMAFSDRIKRSTHLQPQAIYILSTHSHIIQFSIINIVRSELNYLSDGDMDILTLCSVSTIHHCLSMKKTENWTKTLWNFLRFPAFFRELIFFLYFLLQKVDISKNEGKKYVLKSM